VNRCYKLDWNFSYTRCTYLTSSSPKSSLSLTARYTLTHFSLSNQTPYLFKPYYFLLHIRHSSSRRRLPPYLSRSKGTAPPHCSCLVTVCHHCRSPHDRTPPSPHSPLTARVHVPLIACANVVGRPCNHARRRRRLCLPLPLALSSPLTLANSCPRHCTHAHPVTVSSSRHRRRSTTSAQLFHLVALLPAPSLHPVVAP